MILTVTLNPALDQTLHVAGLRPHDTNRILKTEVDAGGKGANLSRVVAILGVQTSATGFLGGGTGAFVRRVLARDGVVDEFIEVPGETRTVWSIESGDGPPTTFNGKGEPVSDEAWNQVVARVSRLAAKSGWVALGGSLPEGTPPEAYALLGRVAREAGAKVLVDADGDAFRRAMEFRPDMVKPNRAEASRFLGRELKTVVDVELAACEIQSGLAPGGLAVVSMGAEGAVLAGGSKAKYYPAIPVRACSTIGSGDSLLAGFLVGLLGTGDLERAMALGLAAGAATAASDGASIGSREQIMEILGSTQPSPS